MNIRIKKYICLAMAVSVFMSTEAFAVRIDDEGGGNGAYGYSIDGGGVSTTTEIVYGAAENGFNETSTVFNDQMKLMDELMSKIPKDSISSLHYDSANGCVMYDIRGNTYIYEHGAAGHSVFSQGSAGHELVTTYGYRPSDVIGKTIYDYKTGKAIFHIDSDGEIAYGFNETLYNKTFFGDPEIPSTEFDVVEKFTSILRTLGFGGTAAVAVTAMEAKAENIDLKKKTATTSGSNPKSGTISSNRNNLSKKTNNTTIKKSTGTSIKSAQSIPGTHSLKTINGKQYEIVKQNGKIVYMKDKTQGVVVIDKQNEKGYHFSVKAKEKKKDGNSKTESKKKSKNKKTKKKKAKSKSAKKQKTSKSSSIKNISSGIKKVATNLLSKLVKSTQTAVKKSVKTKAQKTSAIQNKKTLARSKSSGTSSSNTLGIGLNSKSKSISSTRSNSYLASSALVGMNINGSRSSGTTGVGRTTNSSITRVSFGLNSANALYGASSSQTTSKAVIKPAELSGRVVSKIGPSRTDK